MNIVKLQHFDTVSNKQEDISSYFCIFHRGVGMVKITSYLPLQDCGLTCLLFSEFLIRTAEICCDSQ